MRAEILIALVVGAIFFFASAIVTALAIKYATSSRLWDVVLIAGIAGMIGSVVTLALFVNSQNKGLPILWPALLINLGICLVIAGSVWHFSGIAVFQEKSYNQPNVAPSRIVVTKYILVPTISSDQKSDLEYRIYMTNRGAGPGYGPELTIFSKLSNVTLSDRDVDAEMAKDVAQAVAMPLSRKTQLDVKEKYWYPIPNLYLRATELEEVRRGEKYLYVWVVLTFLDDTLTDSQFWVSEYCGLMDKDPTSIRVVRQRTYLHE